jgi:phosphatidylglycerophosphate synthase
MNEEYLGFSISELRAHGQKTAPNPEKESWLGWFSRFFSIYSTWFFLRTNFTPNQISVIGCVIYLGGLLVIFHPDYYVTLLAPLLYFLSIVVDGSDGEVARIKKNGNRFGGPYVEPTTHDNLYALTFFLVGLAVFLETNEPIFIVAGSLAAICKLLMRLAQIRFWQITFKGTVYANKEAQNALAKKRSLPRKAFDSVNRNFFNYTGMFLPFTLAVIFMRLDLFVLFYAVSFSILYVLLMSKHSYLVSQNFTPPEKPEI